MKQKALLGIVLAGIVLLSYELWTHTAAPASGDALVLHGNVDQRQIELAFNAGERIAEVLVDEGDHVIRGQVLAKLETTRLKPLADQAQAINEAQMHAVERLHNGNRQEEIAQSLASVESAKADAVNARLKFQRLKILLAKRVTSQEDYDNASAALDVSEARLALAQKAYELEIAGPRKEEIAEAEASLRATGASAAFSQRQLADAELIAPIDATIRSRLLEPGEIASPQHAVVSLAVPDPKWIRAYVPENILGKVKEGMLAEVRVDSFPNRHFNGWIGFVSPVAEFTPKTVQTEELRTSLVYEVRVFVKDTADELRLGMPATVHVATQAPALSMQRAGAE